MGAPFIFNSYSVSGRANSRAYSTKLPEPVKRYENADTQKFQILEENKGKSGVYLLRNLTNQKMYIGSSSELRRRFKEYFNINHLLRNKNLPICAALIKYGYSQFSVDLSIVTFLFYWKENNII